MVRHAALVTIVGALAACATYQPRVEELRLGRVYAAPYLGATLPDKRAAVPQASADRYLAVDPIEESLIARASFAYFPDDFREAPVFDPDRLIAWAGIVLEVEFEPTGSGNEMYAGMILDHRYFDFRVLPGVVPFGLSSRGEGPLYVSWRTVDDRDSRRAIDDLVGNMMVLYGSPRRLVGNDVVEMIVQYSRTVPPAGYTVVGIEYGREAVSRPEAWDEQTERSDAF